MQRPVCVTDIGVFREDIFCGFVVKTFLNHIFLGSCTALTGQASAVPEAWSRSLIWLVRRTDVKIISDDLGILTVAPKNGVPKGPRNG